MLANSDPGKNFVPPNERTPMQTAAVADSTYDVMRASLKGYELSEPNKAKINQLPKSSIDNLNSDFLANEDNFDSDNLDSTIRSQIHEDFANDAVIVSILKKYFKERNFKCQSA